MNIGSRLILSFLLVTLLPTIVLALLTSRIISKSMEADAQETINNNLKAAWTQYYSRAQQMRYGMLQASSEFYIKEAVKKRDGDFLRQQLKAWKQYRPHVDLWAIVDERSNTIVSLNTPESGYPLTINGLVDKAVKGKKPIISTEVLPRKVLVHEGLASEAKITVVPGKDELAGPVEIGDGLVIVVVTPVEDDDGSVMGVMVTGDLINND